MSVLPYLVLHLLLKEKSFLKVHSTASNLISKKHSSQHVLECGFKFCL